MSGGVKVTVSGIREFRRNLARLLRKHDAAALKTVSELGDLGVIGAVEFCPIDEGTLVNSIEKTVADEHGSLVAVIRVPLNSPAADYAVSMHEDFYQPGTLSRRKAARVGHDVGRKYIVRGIQAQQENFLIVIRKHLNI